MKGTQAANKSFERVMRAMTSSPASFDLQDRLAGSGVSKDVSAAQKADQVSKNRLEEGHEAAAGC